MNFKNRKIRSTLICIAGLLLTACHSIGSELISEEKQTKLNAEVLISSEYADQHVMVIAHRSCWQSAPENSIQAAKACLNIGVDMLEVDVRLTKDNQLVVMHDETLERTTNGSGNVSDHTLSHIQGLHLREGAGGDTKLTSFSPPSLEQFLSASKGAILINLDLKESLFEQAFQLVTKLGMEDQILIKMNAAADSEKLKNASFVGKVKFMPIIHECTEFYAQYNVYCTPDLNQSMSSYTEYQPVAFEIVFEDDDFLKTGVQAARANGARLWANTMFEKHSAGRLGKVGLSKPDEVWGELVDMGVNMIQTDYPSELIEYLQDGGHRAPSLGVDNVSLAND